MKLLAEGGVKMSHNFEASDAGIKITLKETLKLKLKISKVVLTIKIGTVFLIVQQ